LLRTKFRSSIGGS